jgi:phosphoglycolate phosphatase-like HAD superfamily hydrolase
MYAFALDFDGVICDSIKECCNTSYTAFRTLYANDGFPSKIPIDWVKLFYINRGLVRPASDYLRLWKWIVDDTKSTAITLQNLDQIYCSKAELRDFRTLFLQFRWKSIQEDPKSFVRDNPFYREILEIWKSIPFPKYIVTTKDEKSTRFLLDNYQFEISGLFTLSFGPKPNALQDISRIHQIDISHVRFVDDNPEHIKNCSSTGATCGLIGWGYGPYFDCEMPRIQTSDELLDFFYYE